MNSDADLLVVGGGPAGTAAAIWSAASGLKVKLLERSNFPRHRPGETLHPGLEPIFRQLGVERRVSSASTLRPEAVSLLWAGRHSKEAFGRDGGGSWKGYQVFRDDLDTILIERARELGVEIVQPAPNSEPILSNGRVIGVRFGSGITSAKFVVDATGSVGWLRRRLNLGVEYASPPLRVFYGYCEGDVGSLMQSPSLVGDERGWTWTAQIAPGRLHWTRLAFSDKHGAGVPHCFASFRQLGNIRGADVTWRCVPVSAGPGYFLVGDAACVLDPAASHGVLRALMSGMMASHAIRRILLGQTGEEEVYSSYRAWISQWFESDVRRLTDLYRQIDDNWESRPRATGRKSPHRV